MENIVRIALRMTKNKMICTWFLKSLVHETDFWTSFFVYTGSLAPADFSHVFFTYAHFQKIAQISSLCNFNYISEEIPSRMRFCLLIPKGIWFLRIFARPKKTQQPRTGCISNLIFTACVACKSPIGQKIQFKNPVQKSNSKIKFVNY